LRNLLPDRLVVVSPHLDDAVLSLGAAIARATGSGRSIRVLTVFAGDPGSTLTAGGWDRRGGFATEGEATRARRTEDLEACNTVGAKLTWLSFSESDYAGPRSEDAVRAGVAEVVADAEATLIPGFPLTNPDHAWLARTLLRTSLPCSRVGLYAEQPYRYKARKDARRLQAPEFISAGAASRWIRPAAGGSARRTKRRAILAYRSQMPLLGFARDDWRTLDAMLRHEALRRGEAVLWLDAG
jgi:LmbE family N-acetylglucosaminyl deacetylase